MRTKKEHNTLVTELVKEIGVTFRQNVIVERNDDSLVIKDHSLDNRGVRMLLKKINNKFDGISIISNPNQIQVMYSSSFRLKRS